MNSAEMEAILLVSETDETWTDLKKTAFVH
jgi:hypothetical protein